MKRFKQYLEEVFDRPLPWKWKNSTKAAFKVHNVEYYTQFRPIDNEGSYEMEFWSIKDEPKENVGLKVISTVLDITKSFIKQKDPQHLEFNAVKSDIDDSLDRPSIYKKLVKKFISPDKYNVNIYEFGSNINFEITKK